MLIEGAISVKAALNNGKREVYKVYFDRNRKTKDLNYIRHLAKDSGAEVIEMAREELDTMASGKTYGGIIAEVSARKSDELSDSDAFFLDGIEDPFNLGYIMRTAYAFGIRNVILAKRDYSSMEAQLIKSSAGAFEMLNVHFVDDAEKELGELKNSYTLYSLKRGDDSFDIFDEVFPERSLFMIGGEKRGISSALVNLTDRYLYIPYASDFRNSLNAAGAADVVSTLLFRQKRK